MSVTMIWLVWLFAFSGFFVPIDSIMPALRWMVVINPASYGERACWHPQRLYKLLHPQADPQLRRLHQSFALVSFFLLCPPPLPPPPPEGFALFFQIILKLGPVPDFICAEQSNYAVCDQEDSNGLITPGTVTTLVSSRGPGGPRGPVVGRSESVEYPSVEYTCEATSTTNDLYPPRPH